MGVKEVICVFLNFVTRKTPKHESNYATKKRMIKK